jgi:hypothetical protein
LVVLDYIELYELRDLSFPELDIAPDWLLLDELEKVVLLRRLLWFLNVYVKSTCKNVAVHRDGGVDGVVVFVEHDGKEFAQAEHGGLIVNLEKLFDSHLVEQMDKKLLALLVAHDFSESSKLVLTEFLFACPSFEKDLVNVFL